MKYLYLRQLRDFKKGIFLNVSVFLITLLGIFLFSGLNAVGRDIKSSIDDFYTRQNLADYTVTNKLTVMDYDVISEYFAVDGACVYSAETLKIGDKERSGYVSVFPRANFDVNIPEIIEGTLPVNSYDGLIDEAFAYANGVNVGDLLLIKIGREQKDILICGIARFPDHLYKGDAIPKKEESAIVKVYVKDQIELDTLYISTDLDKDELREKLTMLTGISFSNARVLTKAENTSVMRVQSDIELITSLMNILPIVCLIALCLILYVNMSKRIEDESYNIGVMSANGLHNNKIALSYILPSLCWVMLAGVIGAILGLIILPDIYLSILLRFYTLPDIVHGSTFVSFVLPLVVLAAVTLFSLFVAIAGILKRTPTELMRGRAKKSVKTFANSKMPIVYKLSLRNFISYKKKVFFTVVSATLCLGLLFTSFLLDNSVANLQETVYGKYYNYDASIHWNNGDELSYLQIKDEVESSDCFTDIKYCVEFPASLDSRNIMVSILDGENPCYNLYDENGKIEFGGNGVYIPESYGDLKTVSLTVYAQTPFLLELPVAGHYTDMGLFGVIVPLAAIKNNAPMAYWYITNIEDKLTEVFASVKDGVSQKNLNEFVEGLSKKYSAGFTLSDHSVNTQKFKKLFVVLDITEILLFIVCGIIMVLLILNISCLSITDRVKDYTVFKAMGIGEKKFNMLSALENYFSVFIAFILSIPTGIIITNAIIDVVTRVTGIVVYLHLYWWSVAVLLVSAAIVTAISNVMINKKISKVNVANSLKIKE